MYTRSSSTKGGGLKLVTRDHFVNPGANPACPAGGFSVWTVLQVMEDVGGAIAASDAYMADLSRKNSQVDQIFRAAHVVLWVIFGPLTMQQEVGTYCYLLHRLLGPQ